MRSFSKEVWSGEDQIMLGIDIGTTHSAVSFAHLFKGGSQIVHRVTDWPGQKAQKGESKIPTLIYYDSNKQAVCYGADALRAEMIDRAEDEGWSLARHFKLHLHPKSMRARHNLELRPLPSGVSLDTIYTDFLQYLLKHTQSFFERRVVDGQKIWQKCSQNMLVILTHPNGWAIREQGFLRQAIKNVRADYTGSCRVTFVSEAEASVHFCMFHSNMESTQLPDSDLIICDAGGSTIDTTTYNVQQTTPVLELKERKASACVQTGGLQVDLAFERYLRGLLGNAGIDQDDLDAYIEAGVKDFESTAKKELDSLDATHYINFYDSKFNAPKLGIRRGRMELKGSAVEGFFKKCVSDIITSVREQMTGLSPRYLLLVGGFGESLYLHRRLSLEFTPSGCQVAVVEDSTSKAAADGAVIWAAKLAVVGRVTRVSYGICSTVTYNPSNPEHQGRMVVRGPTGLDGVDGYWFEIIAQGAVLNAKEPARQKFKTSYKVEDVYKVPNVVEYSIWAFHGGQETNQGWILDKNGGTNPGFEELGRVEAKLSDMRGALKRKQGKDGPYDKLEGFFAIRLGGTELSVRVEWGENASFMSRQFVGISRLITCISGGIAEWSSNNNTRTFELASRMPLPGDQQKAAERVFEALYTHKVKGRVLSEMFKELPDKVTWAEYYRVIPEPRSLHGIKDKLDKAKYRSAVDIHSDLELVFANAIHFNEENSTISNDARLLQNILNKEWEIAVSSGTLPKIEPEVEIPNNPPPRQTSRAPRARDTAPPGTPTIRLPKKTNTSTPSASRPATLTPAPQQPMVSQYQPALQHNLVPQVSTPIHQPVPVSLPVPQPLPVSRSPVPPPPAPTEQEEDAAAGLIRDKQGDELVSQLESTLPRCPQPGPEGWMEPPRDGDPADKYGSILNALKEFKDSGGDRAINALECIPEETTNKTLSFDNPIALSVIQNKVEARAYGSPREFDMDLSQLFEKARKWHEEGTFSYGRVLILQILWQSLTSPKQEDMQVDVTSSGTSTTEGLESVTYKGITYRVGDWVHLANKETPPKPVVAQIQRIEKVGSAKTLNLTWYWRPEQTVHSATRSFWEREVFKTGYTSTNSIQEIIEPVACQFFPKHIRGRPSPPMWYPGRPLYVCESRYDSSAKSFSRIKNWSSCIPEGLRKAGGDGTGASGGGGGSGWEYMPIVKFAGNKPVVPRKHPSPFLKGVGGLKKRGGHGANANLGPQKDRSIITAAGGPAVAQASVVEVLPEDTVKHFDRDPHTNQLLWFSGAPIDTPRAQSRQPRHSLDYLYFLARQRERQHRGEDVDESNRKAAAVLPLSVELANLHREVFGGGVAGDGREPAIADGSVDVEMSS